MTSRICKFGCETVLEGWDDNAKKFIEAGTGGLHTKERCQEAKLKLEQKNNHGNELKEDTTKPVVAGYVDHTVPTKGHFRAFTAITVEELNEVANSWLETQKVVFKQWGQLQTTKDGFAIAVYYEEIKQ